MPANQLRRWRSSVVKYWFALVALGAAPVVAQQAVSPSRSFSGPKLWDARALADWAAMNGPRAKARMAYRYCIDPSHSHFL